MNELEISAVASIRFFFHLATLGVCSSTALLLWLIYRAGRPLSFIIGDRDVPRDRDPAWKWLAYAVASWGCTALLRLPGTITEWLTGNQSLPSPVDAARFAILASLISVANSFFFLKALSFIEYPDHLDFSVAAWVGRRGQWFYGVLFGIPAVALVVLLTYNADNPDLTKSVAGSIQFIPSAVVLLAYTWDLTRALFHRRMGWLIPTWVLALVLQFWVECRAILGSFSNVGSGLAAVATSPSTLAEALPNIRGLILSLSAQTLFCVTLLGQALSWFSEMARAAASDLYRIQRWLSDIQARTKDTPIGDRIEVIVDFVERKMLGGAEAEEPAEIENHHTLIGRK